MLQELFFSTQEQTPVFSQAQIDFLGPQIVAAFTQVTSEELISFQVKGNGDQTNSLSGTVTIFPDEILFLSLNHSGSSQKNSSKLAPSSQQLRRQTTLLYSEEQAILQPEVAKRFRNMPSKDPWIAINYATLKPSEEKRSQEADILPVTPKSGQQSPKIQPNKNTLQKQLQELKNTVDEQAEQIRILQQPSN